MMQSGPEICLIWHNVYHVCPAGWNQQATAAGKSLELRLVQAPREAQDCRCQRDRGKHAEHQQLVAEIRQGRIA